LRDGVHPNASGDKKMMDKWYPALLTAFAAARKDKMAMTEVAFVA
jgi:lysophospholipase L1-like esterase